MRRAFFEECSVEPSSSKASDWLVIMLKAPELPFSEGGPEEEKAQPFLEDQRLAFFFTALNLRRCLKLS
jgi:hypothetical protein